MRIIELTEAYDPMDIAKQVIQYQTELDELVQRNKTLEWPKDQTEKVEAARRIHKLRGLLGFLYSQAELKHKGIEPHTEGGLDIDTAIAKIAPLIKKNCQPYLQQIGNNVNMFRMYRGLMGVDKSFITGRVRLEGRAPANTGKQLHNYMNKYFMKTFGEEFRSAMFVSPDPDFADSYGELFLVFPKGEFSYCWSPKVKDIFDFQDDLEDGIDEGTFDQKMDALNYQTDGLTDALKQYKEIMVRVPAYYGLNINKIFGRGLGDDDVGDVDAIDAVVDKLHKAINS